MLLGVVTLVFILIHATPGDPVLMLVGDYPAPEEYVRALREEFALDRSLVEQYLRYLISVARGDLGYSFYHRRPVLELIGERMWATAILTGTALLLATLAGVGFGLLAAQRPFSWVDWSISSSALMGFSVPSFWLGQLLIVFVAVRLGWLPAQGMVSVRVELTGWDRVFDMARHLVLPAGALALRLITMIARLTRAGLLEVLERDFMRTAAAKGLSDRYALLRHGLPNAILPVVTFVGYQLGFVVAGSALIETVFGWPGIGRLLYDSVFTRDHPVILGIFMTVCVSVVMANLLTDLVYGYIDPRIRSEL